jgi:phenylpropionate dioxygenase-like ring-hydroxylating dioxygenase large terminal subunit
MGKTKSIREHFEDTGTDKRITLKWTLKTWHMRVRTGFIWLSKGTSGRKLQIPRNARDLAK